MVLEVRVLYHKPGWTLPNGHVVRSHMEASLCADLVLAEALHQHGTPETLSFQVTIGPRQHALYVPSILLSDIRSGGRQIIIEPIDSVQRGGGARRLSGFRKAHLADYYLIVVARRALHHQLPAAAYDQLFPLEDFRPLEAFLLSLK
jgi:hypothetical protein